MISLWTGVTCSLQEQVLQDPIFEKSSAKSWMVDLYDLYDLYEATEF